MDAPTTQFNPFGVFATQLVEARASSGYWCGSDLSVQKIPMSCGNRYKGFTKKVPTSNSSPMQQLDVLEAFARTERAAPTYCLYNFVDAATDSEHWHCCNPTFQPEQLGCTVIPSSVVRTAIRRHGGKTFDRIHRERVTRPWRCLACQNVLPLQENAPVHSGRMEGAVGPTSDAPLVKAYLTNDNRHEALPDGLRMLLSEEKMSEQRLSSIYRSLYGPAPAIPRRVAVFDVGVKAS